MVDSNGYVDLQVNGYKGVDFNRDGLTAEGLHQACEALAADGVAGILATITTDDVDAMCGRLRRLAELRQRDTFAQEMVVGFHIEGPFLNETEGYRGAHPARWVRPAGVEPTQRLLDAAMGLTRLVTLAPERDAGLATTKMLVGQGIVVSAGHCNPTLDQLDAAIDAGVSMFTHVGNGCPPLIPRHDNIIQRVLSRADRLWPCFIADGAHVELMALGNYLRAAGTDRSIVVTDAVEQAGLGPGRYDFGGFGMIDIGSDLIARAPDGTHLLGSVVTMPKAIQNLKGAVGLSDHQVAQLTVINPRRAIGLDGTKQS